MQASCLVEGSSSGVRKGAWSQFEDELLKDCVQRFGEGKWHLVPQRAGLKRCRKSCRLRWLNYLKPNIKRGEFSEDEVDLMIKLHKLLGNRWSLIAGRLPGRTSNDVKNYWNTNLRNKIHSQKKDKTIMKEVIETMKPNEVIKPQPRTFSKKLLEGNKFIDLDHSCSKDVINEVDATSLGANNWWDTLFEDEDDNNYSWGKEVLQKDFWDEELNSITTNPFDFLNESQIWSEFLSQT